MSTITRFAVRSSGRDLSAVRRPVVVRAKVKVEKPAAEPKKNPEPAAKAPKPDSNDADVKVKKSDG